ncbi:MAG: hypothetical protein IKJ62_03865 [Alphaproteobacteria bacterium]|nr:hypothetical protein [Alphaproteobacteria bacterium]
MNQQKDKLTDNIKKCTTSRNRDIIIGTLCYGAVTIAFLASCRNTDNAQPTMATINKLFAGINLFAGTLKFSNAFRTQKLIRLQRQLLRIRKHLQDTSNELKKQK